MIHSPAEIIAAWPTTVTRSRWPRAFALRTQKPFSPLWKVTRSTRPASTSWVDDSSVDFMTRQDRLFSSSRATPPMPRRWSTARSSGQNLTLGTLAERTREKLFRRSRRPYLVPGIGILREAGTLHLYDAEALVGRRLHHHPALQAVYHLCAQLLQARHFGRDVVGLDV